MRLLVDAIPVRAGSAAVVIGNLLAGWAELAPEDEITVLVDRTPGFPLPSAARVEVIAGAARGRLRRVAAQSLGVRRAARRLQADAVLSAVTATSFLGARCRTGAIVYDVRHEIRPEQFSRLRRIARRLLYGWTFRRADALFCISARTRDDLVRSRPWLAERAHVARLGADHASGWQPPEAGGGRYALAFGHFANKNVEAVLRAWRLFAASEREIDLRICGLGGAARRRAEALVAELDLGNRVDLLPWLSDTAFQRMFAGAAVVLFPSDFEGFGLPAVEAMLLGIPVVISDDPALLEVTGGLATVASSDGAAELAEAIVRALATPPNRLAEARERAQELTWRATAAVARGALNPAACERPL